MLFYTYVCQKNMPSLLVEHSVLWGLICGTMGNCDFKKMCSAVLLENLYSISRGSQPLALEF